MKALLLDKETTAMVSMVYSRSKVLEKEVFLFQRLDAERRGEMLHLKAVVFLRPNRENIALLVKELQEPKFGEYHLFFSNIISNDSVRTLAQADKFELVKQLQEFYADFYAVSSFCFSFSLPPSCTMNTQESERVRDGLFALLLAMKKRPAIRFQRSSKDAERIAGLLGQHIDQHQDVMDFSPAKASDSPPLLLILDRFDDPITPLLNQWTYQAMIHELLGIRNNVVELPGEPGKGARAPSEPQQIVFSAETDDFYRENLYADYGSLHDRLTHALDAFKQANPALRAAAGAGDGGAPAFSSIAEMQRFVERFPEMARLRDCVAKHVNVLHALSRRVEREGVMEASELEQQLACVQDHRTALRQVRARVCVCACVCVRACVRACACACVRVFVHACVQESVEG
jgi:vacuolar protein sorting-associated protein 45